MEYIQKILKKSGWIAIIESLIFAVLGIILIYNPNEVVKVISYILGIIFITAGIIKILNYIYKKEINDLFNYDLVYGILAIIIGIVTIIYLSTIGNILRVIIGIWIIYSSMVRLSLAIKLKVLKTKIWIYSLILAIVMFLCGLYILLNSGAIVVTIGIIMIIYSIIDISENLIFMKNLKEIV